MGNPKKLEALGSGSTAVQGEVINADTVNRAIDGNDAV